MVDEMSAELSHSSRRCLVTLHTPDAKLQGRTLPLGERLHIGRVAADGIDLVIRDRLISSRHATIQRTDSGRYELLDLDSRNGSFVDGERVRKMLLREGQIIRVGITLFELATLSDGTGERSGSEPQLKLVGASASFHHVVEQVEAAAAGQDPVVFIGEPGTGKKRLAKHLHDVSGREGPLVVMECAGASPPLTVMDLLGSGADLSMATPPGDEAMVPMEGYFGLADGGTLVIDHVDELSGQLQPYVLALLRTGRYAPPDGGPERPADVRLVFTSCIDLDTAIQSGNLDAEFATVLAGEHIELPSLRTRRSDIARLARHFLDLDAEERRLEWSPGCLERLLLYDWPVNVRELRVVMARMAGLEEGVQTLRSAHLPREIRRQLRQKTEDALRNTVVTVHAVPSRSELSALLSKHAGDIGALAEHYAKDRRHVRRWLLRHDLRITPTADTTPAAVDQHTLEPAVDTDPEPAPADTLRERTNPVAGKGAAAKGDSNAPASAVPSTKPDRGRRPKS